MGAVHLTMNHCVGSVMDLSRTEEVETALRRSEERFKALYDQSPSISATVDCSGRIDSINSHGAAELGYRNSDLLGVRAVELLHDHDRQAFQDQLSTTSTACGIVTARDFRLLRKDGSIVWVRGSTRSMADSDGQMLVLLVCKDLTEHKENEQRLLEYQAQLRQLTLELGLVEEQERRRIALGLHDHVGHSLALARMKLGAYGKGDTGELEGPLEEVRDLIDDAIRATRALTFELSSPILYELGLEAALRALGDQVVEANGVSFAFECDAEPKPLSTDANVVLYRSVRELLINVVKHASASAVSVQITRGQDRIEIMVADDGVGIDSSIVQAGDPRRGHGLLSIREQLRAIGGRIDVDTAPDQGTKCLLVVPVETPTA